MGAAPRIGVETDLTIAYENPRQHALFCIFLHSHHGNRAIFGLDSKMPQSGGGIAIWH